MRTLFVLLAAILLAGCSTTPARETPAFVTEVAPSYPAECFTGHDPGFADLPDADVRQDEGVRNYRANRRAFRTLAGFRRVCAAALKSHMTTGGP